MAIYNQEQQIMGNGTIPKIIDDGAYELMSDMVQKYQYQYPERSAVRELVSNALDAVTEKNNALKILRGQAKAEDFYVEREGSLYKDSKWNPAYYDENWLATDNNVQITYLEREGQRDLLTIKDFGVGLMGIRLAGYFSLGFSTKRNNKNTLGKYGIGAKSALSTGITSYTVENRYNGMKMLFQVFDHTYQPIIPPHNLETGKENPYVEIEVRGVKYKFHYEPTTEKNGLTLSIECKKHKKQYYIDAVKNQMMYFPNISLSLITESGVKQYIDHKAEILYEDDSIILSDNEVYKKPHMLINKVNYGYIDFRELEMEERYGNIGIKVNPEEVTINPSRESLIWDDNTRNAVLNTYKKVSDIATRMLNSSINTENFVDWMFTVAQLTDVSRYLKSDKDRNILVRLKEIANMKEVEFYFTTYDNNKLYLRDILNAFAMRMITVEEKEKAGNKVLKVTRTKSSASAFNENSKFFIKQEPGASSNKRDKYLFDQYGPFYIIEHVDHAYNYAWYTESETKLPVSKEYMEAIFSMVSASLVDSKYESSFIVYESVEVPDNYSDAEEDLLEAATDEGEDISAVKATRGRPDNLLRVSFFQPGVYYYPDHLKLIASQPMVGNWAFYDVDKADLDRFESPEVYYINHNEEDEVLYAKVAWLTKGILHNQKRSSDKIDLESVYTHDKSHSINMNHRIMSLNTFQEKYEDWFKRSGNNHMYKSGITLLDDKDITVIRASQKSVKSLKRFKHLSLFFAELRNNKISMSNALINWNTARIIQEKFYKCRFLNNFQGIDMERHQLYKKLEQFVSMHYVPIDNISNQGFKAWQPGEAEALVDHCNSIFQFQKLVASGAAPEVIADTAKNLFGNSQVQQAHGADLALVNQFEELLDWCEPYQFLNAIPALVGDIVTTSFRYAMDSKACNTLCLNNELEDAVRKYMQMVTPPVVISTPGVVVYNSEGKEVLRLGEQTTMGDFSISDFDNNPSTPDEAFPPISESLNINTNEHDVHN